MQKQETKSVREKRLKSKKEDSENDINKPNKSNVVDKNYLIRVKPKKMGEKKNQSFETLRLQFNKTGKQHHSGTFGIGRSLNNSRGDAFPVDQKSPSI